jgi:hypothetical protein
MPTIDLINSVLCNTEEIPSTAAQECGSIPPRARGHGIFRVRGSSAVAAK